MSRSEDLKRALDAAGYDTAEISDVATSAIDAVAELERQLYEAKRDRDPTGRLWNACSLIMNGRAVDVLFPPGVEICLERKEGV